MKSIVINDVYKVHQYGDLHGKAKEPYFSATKDFLAYIADSPVLNTIDALHIFSGDIVHSPAQNGAVVGILNDFFVNKIKGKVIIILGNHGQSREKGSFLKAFKPLNNVTVIEEPTEINVSLIDCKILILPYLVRKSMKERMMKEIYEDLAIQLKDRIYHAIIGHYFDETLPEIFKTINTSSFKGPRSHGHYHMPGGNYLGVPVITKKDERGIQPQYCDITSSGLEFKQLPIFLDFYIIEDGQPVGNVHAKHPLLCIKNSKDIKATKKFYQGYIIHEIDEKLEREESDENALVGEITSIPEGLEAFIIKKKIPINIAKDLREDVTL